MDEERGAKLESSTALIWPGSWRDRHVLALLLALAFVLRAWMLWTTEIPSRDGLYFIRYALLFERQDWREVIQQSFQHPGYPLTVLLVSWPVRWLCGTTDCVSMQLSAQLAAALAGWLLVVPMFQLGKQLFRRSVGFWAALFFQCLPESCQILSDALSDPVYLLLGCTALLYGTRGLKDYKWHNFAACGAFCGLAYLVRPEGLVIVSGLAIFLTVRQCSRGWRTSPRAFGVALGSLLAATTLAGSPYYLTTGKLTNKPSSKILLQQMEARTLIPARADNTAPVLFATLLAVHLPGEVEGGSRLWQAGVAVGYEFVHAYQYFGWVPVLAGIWWCRRRRQVCLGHWLMLAVFLTQSLVAWLLAVNLGYVSTRHVLLLVLVSIFQATAVILQVPFRARAWWQWAGSARAGHMVQVCTWQQSLAARAAVLVMVLLIVVGFAHLADPQHDYRKGHLSASRWLIAHASARDAIYDDHSWALYYTGRLFPPEPSASIPIGGTQSYFVVSRIGDRHAESRPGSYTETNLQQKGGTIVYSWPESSAQDQAAIVIYRLSSD